MELTIHYFMWHLLIVVSILILISAIEEFFFDIVYIIYLIYRKWKSHRYHYQPLTYQKLAGITEKKIAILVASWHEELVIGNMLRHNLPILDYKTYDIFVGTYPNDKLTVQAVELVARQFHNLHCVINEKPGPSTKADNLNTIYAYIKNYEKQNDYVYEIFVFHDSEDIIHPLSLKLYNYLIPAKDMVQIPIFPLEVHYSFATHWTYADEFAENHTHTMIVREFIHGLVPSAGVGTGFSRRSIELLAKQNSNGLPFDIRTFTEDYSIALRIHKLRLKSIFLTQTVERIKTKKQFIWFGKLKPHKVKELVATRALFPIHYRSAVRQRARWITGIALQEWRNSGWQGDFATCYTLFHDRKALLTHFINLLGYIVFGYWLIYYIIGGKLPLAVFLRHQPNVFYLLMGCTALMVVRLFQRAWATYKIYGFSPALLSIPRTVYSNLINFHATLRAYLNFFFKTGKKATWDKTKNVFPTSQELKLYKRKLGDLLIQNKLITPQQLDAALIEQSKEHRRLGNLLVTKNLVSPQDVLKTMAEQYGLEWVDIKLFRVLAQHELNGVSQATYQWLLEHNMLPIGFFAHFVTLAIVDPADDEIQKIALKQLHPYEIKFVLSSDAVNYY